jgi:predicted oxidoreductase
METSRIALGVMRIENKNRDEAAKIVQTALDNGITFFDTADVYADGKSSAVLGQALEDVGASRDSLQIQTKFGIVNPEGNGISRYDFSKEHLLATLDRELERLKTDHVDSVLLHRPDTLVDPEEVAEAFNELESSGKVRHFGVSNMRPWQVELIQNAVSQKLEANQLQFGLMHTHMIQQEFEANMETAGSVDHDGGILAFSRLKQMTIQAWSPFQYGFFEGPFIDNPKFPELNKALEKMAEKYSSTKNGIAVAWILRHPAQMQVILGSMNPTRIAEMAAGSDVNLDRQDWWDLYVAAGNIIP